MKRRSKRRDPVIRDDRVGPTPETQAKLVPDPFNVLIEMGMLDTAQRDAGLEIRAIWRAITGTLAAKTGNLSDTRSGGGMSDALAAAHARVYLPWCQYWGRLVEETIDLVVDAQLPAAVLAQLRLAHITGAKPDLSDIANISSMLADYAKRRRAAARMGEAA